MLIRKAFHSAARARRGAALIIALFVVLMISVLSVSYLQMSMSKNREQQNAADAKRAFYLAEAGMAEAYAGLLAGQSGNVGNDIVPARFGAGVFWVKAEDLGNANLCLTSTGLCGSGRACISIVVRNESQSIASQGLFADQGIAINVGSVVDSYDSRLGSYEVQQLAVVPPVVGHGGGIAPLLSGVEEIAGEILPVPGTRVTSNGNITLQGTTSRGEGAQIIGDAQPGPNGVLTRGTGATVTGSTTPSTLEVSVPEVPIPAIELGSAVVHDHPSRVFTPPTGMVGYESLKLSNNAKAMLRGPLTLVVDDLVLEPGANLSIDTSTGPVKIFVRDWLRCDPGSTIVSVNTAPTKCSLMCAGSETVDRDGDGVGDPPVTLASTSEFHGVVYAPHASFTLPNTFQIYGSLAARNLVVAGGGRVHFDRALLDSDSNEMSMPRELCWRLVQLPPSKIVEQRLDPIRYLNALGVVPPVAKDAHYDRGVAVPTAITKVWKRVTVVGL